jgi:hypothetical protein
MATKLTLKINGEFVTKSQTTLERWVKIIGTKNPGALTPVSAVESILAENPGYIEAVNATYDKSDTLEIFNDGEFKGGNTFAGFVERMEIARRVKYWMGEIPSTEGEAKESPNKGQLEV